MHKFILSTDSTCDLYADFIRENDIKFVSLTYTVEKNGKMTDGLDAFQSYAEYVDFYKQLREGAFSRTSMLNYESHYTHFRKLAEEGAKDPALREKFDVCCARAVARLNTLSEYCAPFVKTGGRFIAYKGKADEEIAEAKHAFCVLGLRLIDAQKAELPCGEGERTIVVAEKIAKTPAAYPRGRGKERSAPL